MAFAMKMRFVDVIQEGSLQNIYANGEKIGFKFDVRLGYYRGHYLSCVDELKVSVDSEEIEENIISFAINGKEFSVSQLKEAYTEFWSLLDPATISVIKKGGLAEGEHSLKVDLMLRVPYMAIGENQYMPLDSGEERKVKISG